MTETQEQQAKLEARIGEYLSSGGLFNPESMDHHKVRDLLIECRAALRSQVQTETTPTIAALEAAHKELVECVQRQWDGQAALKMSIPARPDHDSDLVIGAALRRAIAVLRSAPVLRQQEKKPEMGPLGLRCARCRNAVDGPHDSGLCRFCRADDQQHPDRM